MQHNNQHETWRAAAVIVVLTAVIVFFTQHFVTRFLNDVVLEVCIFYIPALVSVILYLYSRRRL